MRGLNMSTAVVTAAMMLTSGAAIAQEQVEVLHWWTSGGEAAALNVLKEDLQAQGIGWLDMPVAGGGGEGAMTVLRARVTAGSPPTAVQMLGFDILDWAAEGALGNLDELKRFRWVRYLEPDRLNADVHKFRELTGEVTFIIRALFFLIFGYLIHSAELLDPETLAWSAGNRNTYWGVGPDGDQGCENCCAVCGATSISSHDLIYVPGRDGGGGGVASSNAISAADLLGAAIGIAGVVAGSSGGGGGGSYRAPSVPRGGVPRNRDSGVSGGR